MSNVLKMPSSGGPNQPLFTLTLHHITSRPKTASLVAQARDEGIQKVEINDNRQQLVAMKTKEPEEKGGSHLHPSSTAPSLRWVSTHLHRHSSSAKPFWAMDEE
jgi:hypothetical protein